MSRSDPPACARCGRPVHAASEQYESLERMHYVCFHYEFEHNVGGEGDPDIDCGVPGCPSGVTPVATLSSPAQALLTEIAETLRSPHDEEGWSVDIERPGVLRLVTPATIVRLVLVESRD